MKTKPRKSLSNQMELGSVAGSVSLCRFLSAKNKDDLHKHTETHATALTMPFGERFQLPFIFHSAFRSNLNPRALSSTTKRLTRVWSRPWFIPASAFRPSLEHLMIKSGGKVLTLPYLQEYVDTQWAGGQTGDRMSCSLPTKVGGLWCFVGKNTLKQLEEILVTPTITNILWK